MSRDAAICHICVTAVESGKMKDSGNVDDAFIYSGYSNWKNASGKRVD